MNSLKIKTAKELNAFLRVLAEESVMQARSAVPTSPSPDERARQAQMSKQIGQDKRRFMSEEDPVEPDQTQDTEKEEPKTQVSASQAQTSSEISPKYESLVDAINSLRGAGSTRDSTVDAQLRAYYDKLDAAECSALIVMLRSVTDVMTGVVPGDQAKDPSSYKILVTMEQGADSAKSDTTSAQPEEAPESPEEQPEAESEEDQENTEPPQKLPINVGQGMTESYRRKIRELLRNAR